ncbi:MAG: adenylate/guanylate cyclase domain-containing protein [Alphaproteobacteria bacterium]|nr:adenylate/guanylate cyclase domain-containing protein [Alphaproteobacteria bacterium]
MTRPPPSDRLLSVPKGVTVIRRERRPDDIPERMGFDTVHAWLFEKALMEPGLLDLYQGFCWRLVAAGFPLDRSTLHVGTLHPQLFGYAWNWERESGYCQEVKVGTEVFNTEAYQRSPLRDVLDRGKRFSTDPSDRETAAQWPVIADLTDQGYTQYIAFPLTAGAAYHNSMSFATKQSGGFSEENLATLDRLLRVFALHVEGHIARRIGANALNTYLGPVAGKLVLAGSIRRGDGDRIRSIVWVSDLRGFTLLADRLAGDEMTALLNAYFEVVVGSILEVGGDVLKFIGDGLLAVFPIDRFADEAAAAEAALTAAETALARLDALNADPNALPGIEDWRPLKNGIALHYGDVFFGNVGAPARLDFTVIGRAVNMAARLEALTKGLGRSLVISQPVAELIDRPLADLGEHALRGVADPVRIYGVGS